MMKIFFLTICIFCFTATTAFAGFHENGIGEFYFGETKEKIQQQYILFDEQPKEDKIYYSIIAPSFDFYGIDIEQPISLGFKNNLLVTIHFRTPYASLEDIKSLQQKLMQITPKNFGKLEFLLPGEAVSVQEDRLLSISCIDMRDFLPPLFILEKKNYTYLSVYMTKDAA